MSSLDRKLVQVYVAADEIEAKHIELILADHHIQSRTVGGGLVGGAGELPPGWALSPRIWVDKEYEDQARTIVKMWELDRNKKRDNPTEEWQCSECESMVPGDFEICWQCQAEKS